METKIINGFKGWWGKFAEDRAISFCSKWCSGWNPQLRSHYVTDDQKMGGKGKSLSVCLTPHALHLSISFWPHSGYRARWIFAFLHDNSMAVILLRFSVRIYDWSIYLFLFVCFSASSVTISCGWPKCISEFVPHSSSKWQRKSPIPIYKGILTLGRVCWAGKGPEGLTAAFLLFTVHVVPWRNGCAVPCHASPSPASPPRTGRLWADPVLMTKAQWEKKTKPLGVAKPSSP